MPKTLSNHNIFGDLTTLSLEDSRQKWTVAWGLEPHARITDIFSQKSDPYEIKSGMECCFQLLEKTAKDAKYGGVDFFADEFIRIIRENIEKAGQFFLFCTSKIQDDPHQSETFADGGKGACLEFSSDFPAWIEGIPPEDDGISSNGLTPTFSVSYDNDGLVAYVSPFIQFCVQKLDEGLAAAKPDKKEAMLFLQSMTVLLAAHLISHCTSYKPESFSKENEMRTLRVLPYNRKAKNIKTKKSENGDKVYVECAMDKKMLKAVWLGPKTSDEAEARLKKILSENGWEATKIIRSGHSSKF